MRDPETIGLGGDGDDDATEDAFEFDTVILPARLDADVARRIAVASNREGVSIADLIGRAVAAYDWSESEPGDRRTGESSEDDSLERQASSPS